MKRALIRPAGTQDRGSDSQSASWTCPIDRFLGFVAGSRMFAFLFVSALFLPAGSVANPQTAQPPLAAINSLDLPPGMTWGEFVHAYRMQVLKSLQASHDARELLLASIAMTDTHHESSSYDPPPTAAERKMAAALLRRAAQMAPRDPLVQRIWARASTAASGCQSDDSCVGRAEAEARLEPDNAAAWEPVVAAAMRNHDLPNAERALARMAIATRYDDHFGEAALAFRAIYRQFPAPEAPPGLRASAETNPWMEFPTTAESHQERYAKDAAEFFLAGMVEDEEANDQPLGLCTKEALRTASRQRAMDCAGIGRLLMRNGDSVGLFYIADTGFDTEEDRERARMLDWQIWMEDEAGSRPGNSFALRLGHWFSDLEETGNAHEADRRALTRRGIPLKPTAGWTPDPDGMRGDSAEWPFR